MSALTSMFVDRHRQVLLTAAFVLFLYPLSISSSGGGLSANYTFLALPAVYALRRGFIRLPSERDLLVMAFYTLIALVSMAIEVGDQAFVVRRFVSLALFLTMFSYLLVDMDEEMAAAFKTAVVVISVGFSLRALVVYVTAGGMTLGAAAKSVVGTSRFGFIYMLAVWLVLLHPYAGRFRSWRYPALLVLVIGVFLTFSRSSIVSLVGSLSLFLAAAGLHWVRRPYRLPWKQIALTGVVVGFVGYGVASMVPGAVAFFQQRLVTFFLDRDAVSEALLYENSSEGFRFYMFSLVLDYLDSRPLTGSGFLGVWLLFPDHNGSAHNQYLDVLFRTGWVGLMVYLALLARVGRYLWRYQPALFWGFVGVLIYGQMHETFKESQGACVLAVLMGMAAQHIGAAPTDVVTPQTQRQD